MWPGLDGAHCFSGKTAVTRGMRTAEPGARRDRGTGESSVSSAGGRGIVAALGGMSGPRADRRQGTDAAGQRRCGKQADT